MSETLQTQSKDNADRLFSKKLSTITQRNLHENCGKYHCQTKNCVEIIQHERLHISEKLISQDHRNQRRAMCSTRKVSPRWLHSLATLYIILFFATRGTSGIWWSPAGRSALINSSRLCQWARQVGGPQLEMCRRQPHIMKEILSGIELGAAACQDALKQYRWNCSQESKPYFNRVMNQDTRETAFVHALTAAATTYQVTLACARGDIAECGCANNRRLTYKLLRLEAAKHNKTVHDKKLRMAVDAFDWGGCDDNIEYGIMKSRAFLTVSRRSGRRMRGAVKAKLKLHNQNAGRMAIKNYRETNCHCHGLSGSCTMWTCWKILPHFSAVRMRLRNKYNSPVRVVGGKDGEALRPIFRRFSKKRKGALKRRTRSANSARSNGMFKRRYTNRFRKVPSSRSNYARSNYPRSRRMSTVRRILSGEDLVYSKKSPRYCSHSKKQGSYGTKGRVCELKKRGLGSCRYLCCGRGYKTVNVLHKMSCNCHFEFCCRVECDTCVKKVKLHYCR